MKILKGLKKQVITLIFLSVMLSYLNLQIAVYIGYGIDGLLFQNIESVPSYCKQVFQVDSLKGLGILSGILFLMNLVIALVNYIRERIMTGFTLKINSNVKQILYAHILKLEYESYNSYSKPEMLQRVNEDAQEYSNFFKVQFNLILDMISFGFFILTQGISLSASVTLYLVITIIVMLVFSYWYYRRMGELLESVIERRKKLLEVTINNVKQFKFVRIYNRQKEEMQKYRRLNKDYMEQDWKFIKLILFYEIVSEHITYFSKPIIFLLAGLSIIKGTMTLGTLMALLILATKILNCICKFGEHLDVINSVAILKKKIQKLMVLKEEKEECDSHAINLNGDITFCNVAIYDSEREILSNLNFTIRKEEKIAIVGENGSGKSLLAKAILGFCSIQGNIYLNFHNMRDLEKSNIRQSIDYIMGETDLFSGTIKENITLKGEYTQEQVTEVVREAEMEQDIKQLEAGYQTVVGERGIKLSGGQKQRILIARALLRNKPIMIFDDSFSKLDTKTTNRILQNLIQNYPKTTMIFITHKLEVQDYVDRIIKIEKGTNKNEIKRNVSRHGLS